MVKVFQEAVKRLVKGKWQGNGKTTVVCNEKVVQVIHKVGNHEESFTFHHDKGTNHGMVEKVFPTGMWIFLNGR